MVEGEMMSEYVNGTQENNQTYSDSTSDKLNRLDFRLNRVETALKHLEILPKIHEVLCEMKRDLLEPAVGKKQMPISIAIMMIAILGGLLVFREVKDSSKDVTISAAGLKITSGEVLTKKGLGGAE